MSGFGVRSKVERILVPKGGADIPSDQKGWSPEKDAGRNSRTQTVLSCNQCVFWKESHGVYLLWSDELQASFHMEKQSS